MWVGFMTECHGRDGWKSTSDAEDTTEVKEGKTRWHCMNIQNQGELRLEEIWIYWLFIYVPLHRCKEQKRKVRGDVWWFWTFFTQFSSCVLDEKDEAENYCCFSELTKILLWESFKALSSIIAVFPKERNWFAFK